MAMQLIPAVDVLGESAARLEQGALRPRGRGGGRPGGPRPALRVGGGAAGPRGRPRRRAQRPTAGRARGAPGRGGAAGGRAGVRRNAQRRRRVAARVRGRRAGDRRDGGVRGRGGARGLCRGAWRTARGRARRARRRGAERRGGRRRAAWASTRRSDVAPMWVSRACSARRSAGTARSAGRMSRCSAGSSGAGPAVLAAGGISSEADLEAVERTGCEAAVVGRALLEGRIALERLAG